MKFTLLEAATVSRSQPRLWWLGALLMLCACGNPEPPVKVTMNSRALGAISLEWLTTNRAPTTDSSGRLRLTPLSYSDLDDLSAGLRYLTMTFGVENLSAQPLENVTLRAVATPGSIGGTALTDLRAFPSAQQPDGEAITDASVAARFLPLHATILLAQPGSDPDNSDFQAYTAEESLAFEADNRLNKALDASNRALDYGFVVQSSAGAGRRLEAGQSGRVSVAFRVPRSLAPLPKPYRFKLSFLLAQDDRPRVTRGFGETTQAAERRARDLGSPSNPTQLALFGVDSDAPSDVSIGLLRIAAPRIGLEPPVRLEVGP